MTVRTKRRDLADTQTDWERLRTMTDADIARAVADDPDAAPIPTTTEMGEYKPAPPLKVYKQA